MDDAAFESRCETIGGMIDRREWQTALDEATSLALQAPDRAKAFNLLNVAACLAIPSGATDHSPFLIERAQACEDATDELIGDMHRDRAIALIRMQPIYGFALEKATEAIAEVKRLHASDKNRMACIIGVEARLFFAKGLYYRAAELHAEADRMWQSLGSEAYPQWIYNNYVHWLRATIAAYGRYARMARRLAGYINTRCPAGAKKRTDEVVVMFIPFIGLWLYERITSRHLYKP